MENMLHHVTLLSVQLMCFVVFSAQQMEVDSGMKLVKMPFETTFPLPKDAKVMWMNKNNCKVHIYHNGSDQPKEQDHLYRDRTKMNEDRVKIGDFSLTLMYPTDRDTNTYTCTVQSNDGNIVMEKQVELKVRGQCCRYRSKVRGHVGVYSLKAFILNILSVHSNNVSSFMCC